MERRFILHIPDGYLSPQTYVPFFAFIIPYLGIASKKVSKFIRSRHVPLLALGAAFSFVIMMFNIPIPGGTTGHAVGGVIVAILLGPWAASIAVSIALIVQALLFGDGGITAIGANCFNMGVVIPFVGYYTYKLIAGNTEVTSPRRWMAGAAGGYVGLNVAAVIAGIELGIQPLIATAPDGHPLYAPYPLAVAVPAMAIEHLILFGIVEALVTALIIISLQKADQSLLTIYGGTK
jgi:cobalt/nickel transport system permease protein